MIPLLVLSLRVTAVVALTGLLLLLLRNRSAAQRNLVVRIAIVVAALLPLAMLVAPRIEVAPPVRFEPGRLWTHAPAREIGSTPASNGPTPLASRLGEGPGAIAFVPAAEPPKPARPFPWALAYGLGVAFVVGRWAVGLSRLARLRRTAEPSAEADVWRAAVPVPATYGRTILVPQGSAEWPEVRLRAAILHERAHVRRGDWLWQTFAGGLAALHWFNPFVWGLARLLRDTAEAAADDAVLAVGLAPSAYARELLAVAADAQGVGAPGVGPAMTMARRGGVKCRIAAILAVSRDRRAPTRRAAALLAGGLAASGFAVAGLATRVVAPPKAGVRLVDVRQIAPVPSARWSLAGVAVATPDEVAEDPRPTLGFSPRGMRRFGLRFAVDGYDENDAVHRDELRIVVDGPAKVETYGRPHGKGQPAEGRDDGSLELVMDAPEAATHAHLKVGRASGPYRTVAGPKIAFKAVSEPISWPEGTFDGATIAFAFPRALKDLDYRVFVLTDKGRVDVRDNEVESTDDADELPRAVSIAIDSPAHVRGIGIETREYKETAFDVPLRPQGPLVTPNRTDSVHSIELIRLAEGEKAWLPDGTPAKPLGTIASRYPANPGERKLTLAFRVRGTTWSNPSLLPNVGEATRRWPTSTAS